MVDKNNKINTPERLNFKAVATGVMRVVRESFL